MSPVDDLATFLDAWRAAAGGPVVAEVGGVELRAALLQKVLAIAAEDVLAALELPVRFHNALRQAGIHTAEQLAARTREQLLEVRNVGVTGVVAVRAALAERGLHLADEAAPRSPGRTQ